MAVIAGPLRGRGGLSMNRTPTFLSINGRSEFTGETKSLPVHSQRPSIKRCGRYDLNGGNRSDYAGAMELSSMRVEYRERELRRIS